MELKPKTVALLFLLAIVVGALFSGSYIVPPGMRGVKVTLGTLDENFLAPGPGIKLPFITEVEKISVRQETREILAACYSQDMQQVTIKLKVIYAVPEQSVVKVYKDYQGDAFDSLVAPRVQEALKEQTALMSAEQIVKQREDVKQKTKDSAVKKVGSVVEITDVILENIDLSKQLEEAIESKMVQEQNANKAKFEQEKRKIDADTKVIEAKAEAEAIKLRGEALKATPDLIQLMIVEKWDGHSPMVVGGTNNPTSVILPMPEWK
ncbi:prohibitin family protein [soil metagenome]